MYLSYIILRYIVVHNSTFEWNNSEKNNKGNQYLWKGVKGFLVEYKYTPVAYETEMAMLYQALRYDQVFE